MFGHFLRGGRFSGSRRLDLSRPFTVGTQRKARRIMKRFQLKALVSGATKNRDATETIIAVDADNARRIFRKRHTVITFHWVKDVTDAQTGWTHVAFVKSDSEPDEVHEVRRRVADGVLGCDCKSYQFAKGVKTCHHLAGLAQTTGAQLEQSVKVQRSRRGATVEESVTVIRRKISLGPITLGGGR
jgi:hypothetical protein